MKRIFITLAFLVFALPVLAQQDNSQTLYFNGYSQGYKITAEAEVYTKLGEVVHNKDGCLEVTMKSAKILSIVLDGQTYNSSDYFPDIEMPDGSYGGLYEGFSIPFSINANIKIEFEVGNIPDDVNSIQTFSTISPTEDCAFIALEQAKDRSSAEEIWKYAVIGTHNITSMEGGSELAGTIRNYLKIKANVEKWQEEKEKRKIDQDDDSQPESEGGKDEIAREEVEKEKNEESQEKEENKESENSRKNQNESNEYPTVNGVEVTYNTKLYYDYMEQAKSAEASGDYTTAINYYQKAYDVIPSPSLKLKIKNLRELQGAAAMVEAASLLSQIEVKGFGGFNGVNLSTFKSSNNTRDISLAYQNGMFNRVFAGGFESGFSGSIKRNIDVYIRPSLGLGIGTSHFGVYVIGFGGLGYRLKQWDYYDYEGRLLLHPGWGFKSYIKLKNSFINIRLCKVYGSGRLNGTWEFGVGMGWKN